MTTLIQTDLTFKDLAAYKKQKAVEEFTNIVSQVLSQASLAKSKVEADSIASKITAFEVQLSKIQR